MRPRPIDPASRVSLALLAKLFDWRSALVVVQPATLIRWHRAGWRLLWRAKSRRGRPATVGVAGVDPQDGSPTSCCSSWGFTSHQGRVRKYMPKRPRGQPRGDQRWSTFLKNHATAILACDFFVVVTATFRMPPSYRSLRLCRWAFGCNSAGGPVYRPRGRITESTLSCSML